MNSSLATTPSKLVRPLPRACLVARTEQLPQVERESLSRLSQALDVAVELDDEARRQAVHAALAYFAAHADLGLLLHGSADEVTSHHESPPAAGYRRHLLLADPGGRYSAVAIVWDKDQYSPVHGHHTWCAYSVLQGTLSESCFEWCEAEQAARLNAAGAAGAATLRLPGEVSYTEAGHCGIHRLGNPHSESAISVHIYGVPGEQIATAVNDLVAVNA